MSYSKFDKTLLTGGRGLEVSTVTTTTTAGAVSFTAAGLLGGLILRDPAGAARADLVPTAALLLAAIKNANNGVAPPNGTSFEFTIRNTADAAETITVTTASGMTLSGTMTIDQNASKRFLVVLTDNRDGNAAFTVYSLGTVVH